MFKVAAAAALLTGGNSSMFAAADCEDIKALPTSTMTQDVRLFLDDLDSLSCDEVRNEGAPHNMQLNASRRGK